MPGLEDGLFIKPTILVDVNNDMRIAQLRRRDRIRRRREWRDDERIELNRGSELDRRRMGWLECRSVWLLMTTAAGQEQTSDLNNGQAILED